MAHELQLTTDSEDVTLPIGEHPDGVLTFEGGTAAVDDESVARVIDDTYPNIEYVGGGTGDDVGSEPDQEGDDVVVGSPIDPSEYTIDELVEELDDGDYTEAELRTIRDAEKTGEERSGAIDAVGVRLEDDAA